MRRTDYQSRPHRHILFELFAESIGYLGIIDSFGFPRPVPVHFVEQNGKIYFHGALEGEKYEAFLNSSNLTFTLIKSMAMIPSYWLSKKYACPATTYYLSAYTRSKGRIVDSISKKAEILQSIMEKYQPEGGFNPIRSGVEMYRKPLEKTGVFELLIENWDVKCKTGQNLNSEMRGKMIERLLDRGTPDDLQTAGWMQYFEEHPDISYD